MQRLFYQATKFVCESVEKFGLNIDAQSRLALMKQCLCGKDDSPRFISVEDPLFETALEALRDVRLLEFVFDNIDWNSVEIKRIVQRLLKDSVLPQNDTLNSPGRDAQVELYVGAVCRKAGLPGVNHEEPDIVCSFRGKPFGVAIKRIKSQQQFVNRVREGAIQIQKAKLDGVVVIDTSIALNPNNQRIPVYIPQDEFARNWLTGLRKFIRENLPDLLSACHVKGMLGVVLLDSQIRPERDGTPRLDSMTINVPTVQYNQHRQREFEDFVETFCSALPNREKL
jgi:hypothetical protein